MSLRIGDAIGDGVRRALTYSGGVLMLLTFLYQLLFLGAVYTVFAEFLPAEAQGEQALALTLPVPLAAAAAIAVVGLLFGIVLYLAATRALTRDQSELDSLPTELFTRRMGRAVLSAVGVNLVVSVAVTIGFVLLVVPGIYLAISFIFVVFAIGVEDERAIDSLRRSWELAGGDRWSLFALGLLVAVITGVGSSLGSAVSVVDPVVGQVVSLGLTGVFTIISYGILAEAYLQLRETTPPRDAPETPAPDVDPAA